MKNNLFYLIGFQRSGTTLLCHLLDKHPEIVCAEEPELSKRLVFEQFQLLQDPEFDSIKKSLDFYGIPARKYTELVDSYLNSGCNEDEFLRSAYALFDHNGALQVGAKEVMDLTSVQFDYFPKLIRFHQFDLKIVFIERDIKGVVNSFIKLGFFPPGKKRTNMFFLKRFAKKYVKTLNIIEGDLSRVPTHFLTYEDLIANPGQELKKIYTFLEADSSDKVLDMILNTESRGIRNHYKGIKQGLGLGWQKSLSPKQVVWLDKLYRKKRKSGRHAKN